MLLKFEHSQIIICAKNFFLYFEFDDFLTQFRLIVILIVYVMYKLELHFSGFTFI